MRPRRRAPVSGILTAVTALLAAFLLAAPPPLEAAYGIVDITPPEALPLGGYTERRDKVMDGVGDRLSARVLRLRQGDTEAVLIIAEALTVPGSLSRAVRERFHPSHRRFALSHALMNRAVAGSPPPPSRQGRGDRAPSPGGRAQDAAGVATSDRVFLMAATHTHSAPDSQALNDRMRMKVPGIATFKQKWLDWYGAKIGELAEASSKFEAVKEVRIIQASAEVNRGRAEGRRPDRTVTQVRFDVPGGHVSILHFAAHPTLYGEAMNRTSGDWPGAWMGPETRRLFFNGAMGDVSPAPPGGGSGKDAAGAMAEALNEALAGNGQAVAAARLQVASAPIVLPEVKPHPEFAERNGARPALAGLLVKQFAPRQADVTVIRYGPLAFIGIPGGPTAAVGRRIAELAKKSGVRFPLVISFANEWLGYILTREEYEAGGYEATLSFHGPGLADAVAEAAEEAIRRTSASKD